MGVTPKLDPSKLTPEQRNQLETYHQTQDQLQTLHDIADMTQEMLNSLADQKEAGSTDSKQMGALLTDMRESLAALKDKQAPESPDYAQPVVEAIEKAQTALSDSIKAINVKPDVRVAAPNVTTPPIDLSGVESVIRKIPEAFEAAIKLIDIPKAPKTNFQPLLDAWGGISDQLLSIENATRAKPLPGSMSLKLGNSAVSDDNPLPVTGDFTATIDPDGLATSAKQDSLLTELQLKADLTETQPVSLASVPSHNVTNAGTFLVQNNAATPAGNNNIGDVDVATLPVAFNTGTRSATTQRVTVATDDSVPVTGTFWQATQPVSGTFYQVTQPVSIAATVTTKKLLGSTTANTNVSTSTTVATALSSNVNRIKATIYNDSTTGMLLVKEGTGASATSYTHVLSAATATSPGGEAIIDDYYGDITVILTAGTGTARVGETTP